MPAGEALGPAAICGTVVSGGGALVPGAAGPGVGVPAGLRDGLVDADAGADTEADGAAEAEVDGDARAEPAGRGSDGAGEPTATASPPQPSEPPRGWIAV